MPPPRCSEEYFIIQFVRTIYKSKFGVLQVGKLMSSKTMLVYNVVS